MPLHVLDTDTLSLLQRGHRSVAARVSEHGPDELAITVVTVEEQLGGWFALLRRVRVPAEVARVYQRLADAVRLLGQIQILSFSEEDIARYEALRALRLNVGSMDLKIAAITLAHGGILVTRNRIDFQRVPGLAIMDWSA